MKKIDYYEICNRKLKYLNYSDKTIKSYLFYINQFLSQIDCPPSIPVGHINWFNDKHGKVWECEKGDQRHI
jgi:hypothetical protein